MSRLAEAALGGDTVDVAVSLQIALSLGGRGMSPRVTPRRFPPPWLVEETDACFIVRDNGQKLAYVYFEDEPGRRAAAKLLTQ